jgi:hypothetical protein
MVVSDGVQQVNLVGFFACLAQPLWVKSFGRDFEATGRIKDAADGC